MNILLYYMWGVLELSQLTLGEGRQTITHARTPKIYAFGRWEEAGGKPHGEKNATQSAYYCTALRVVDVWSIRSRSSYNPVRASLQFFPHYEPGVEMGSRLYGNQIKLYLFSTKS